MVFKEYIEKIKNEMYEITKVPKEYLNKSHTNNFNKYKVIKYGKEANNHKI
jgi:hypothetical protein